MKRKKQSFMHGAFLLTVSTVIVKFNGFLFTIFLSNMIGTEGMGYYYISYELYSLLATIYSAGLPIALSKMISEADSRHDIQGVNRITGVATVVLLCFGITLGLIMFLGANVFAEWLKNPLASYSIKALSPLVLFFSIMCIGRGYFQGLSNMIPTAISSVIEAIAKLFLGVGLAWIILKNTSQPELASAGAITGVTVGSLLGAIYIYAYKKFNHLNRQENSIEQTYTVDNKLIFKRMIRLAIPITLGTSVFSIVNFLDAAIVLRQLQDGAGFSNSLANQLYGILGNTKKLYNLPIAFIIPLTTSALPALASAKVNDDEYKISENSKLAVKLTALIAFSTGIGFMALSKPIFKLIYHSDMFETEIGSRLLFIFGIATVLCSYVMITNIILQALGKLKASVISMVIGGILKVITSWYFVSNVNINIYGAAISTCICYLVIVVFNMITLLRIAPSLSSSLKQLYKPLLSGCVMALIARAAYSLVVNSLGSKLSCVLAIIVGACVFAFMIIFTKYITKSDLDSVPKGEKIAIMLHIK